jgi:hypothetical protein
LLNFGRIISLSVWGRYGIFRSIFTASTTNLQAQHVHGLKRLEKKNLHMRPRLIEAIGKPKTCQFLPVRALMIAVIRRGKRRRLVPNRERRLGSSPDRERLGCTD